MLVLVEGSAGAVCPAHFQLGDVCVGEWCGSDSQGCCLVYRLVGPVKVVVQFELAKCVAQMALVPDEGVVQQFVAAGLEPAFHDRVHARYPDAGACGLCSGVVRDVVEEGWVLRVLVPD
ncbi:hypothetical protein OHA47_08990 [Streptomyces sp. NBC_00498]